MDSKDTGVSSKTTELKRSARLSRKRTVQDSVIDRQDDSNEGGKLSKILKSTKIKSEICVTPKNDIKNYNNRDCELSNVSKFQSSPNTVVDNDEKMRVRSLPRAFKNKNSSKTPVVTDVNNVSTVYNVNTEDGVRSKHEKSDDLVKLTRKRGRPSQKELQLLLRDAGKVNTSCDVAEISFNINESESTSLNENDRTPTPERSNYNDGPSKPKRKRIGNKSSTANVEVAPSIKSEYNNEVLPDANEPLPSLDETFDREIRLVSNRFNVSCDTLRSIVEKESLSVFREKYSDTVTIDMVTVSPVVSMINNGKRKSERNSNGACVKYKIEPIRESVAYEKTNLKDTMEEISKAMPSWTLSIVASPPRYVISHMSIEKYGTPVANKSVVLDRYFRASVYINQRLEYKYCKRYTTASEIVNLIKELDALQ